MSFSSAVHILALLSMHVALGMRAAIEEGTLLEADAGALGTQELVVTTWNIISFSRARNPFEFKGSTKAEVQALEDGGVRLQSETRTVGQYIGAEGVQKVDDAMSKCEIFEVKGIRENCEKTTLEERSRHLKQREQLTVQEFWKTVGTKEHKMSTIDYKWQKRIFNEDFNCNPLSKNGELSPEKFKFAEVIDIIIFDMILKTLYASTKGSFPSLDATRLSICESMFSADGPKRRIASVMYVLTNLGTDVGFLNEIPKMWLTVPEGAQSQFTRSPLSEEANRYGFQVFCAPSDQLDKDDNTVILVKRSSFINSMGSSGSLELHPEHMGLSIKLVPQRMSKPKPITLLGMHMSSKWNEKRKASIEFAAELSGALIAAADTNGEPRSRSYQKEDYYYEPVPDSSHEHPLYRATDAPWHRERPNEKLGSEELATIPAYGTCNKVRTDLQSQLRKAGKLDRLMKDNIYYKSGPEVAVEQVDLCSDCRPYTYGGKMKCFSVKPTPDEMPMLPADKEAFPTTCGYLGETMLPDTSQDWAISDHSPVTARLKLTESVDTAPRRLGDRPKLTESVNTVPRRLGDRPGLLGDKPGRPYP